MFTCRDAAQLMTDEREGALAGSVATKYRIHMLICFFCRRCRKQLDESIRLSSELEGAEVSKDVEGKALAAFRARGRRA